MGLSEVSLVYYEVNRVRKSAFTNTSLQLFPDVVIAVAASARQSRFRHEKLHDSLLYDNTLVSGGEEFNFGVVVAGRRESLVDRS